MNLNTFLRSISEILIGFDIDCCCVAYDGSKVYAIPRSRRAISTHCMYMIATLILISLLGNLVDLSRRSFTYEDRLLKYARRGFKIAIPGMPSGIAYDYRSESKKPTGLVKILDRVHRYVVSDAHFRRYPKPSEIKKRDDINSHYSDYAWLPSWAYFNEETIQKLYDRKRTEFKCKDGSVIRLIKVEDLPSYPIHTLWITDNPGKISSRIYYHIDTVFLGRQMFTSSFHPIEESPEEWVQQHLWDEKYVRFKVNTIASLFHQRIRLKQYELKNRRAKQVLQRIVPNVGLDIAHAIIQYLSPTDILSLTLVCSIPSTSIHVSPATEATQVPPISLRSLATKVVHRITPFTYEPPLSAHLDVASDIDICTLPINSLVTQISPICSIQFTERAMELLHSLIYTLLEKLIHQTLAIRAKNVHAGPSIRVKSAHIAVATEQVVGSFLSGIAQVARLDEGHWEKRESSWRRRRARRHSSLYALFTAR